MVRSAELRRITRSNLADSQTARATAFDSLETDAETWVFVEAGGSARMENVLVPVDGSDPARRALEHAIDHFPDATLTLLYVMDPLAEYSRRRAFPGYREADEFRNEREKADALFESLGEAIPDEVTVETAKVIGKPSRAIVQYVEDESVDHVVMGSHGRTGPSRVLLGSVSESVVRQSPVSVTVVRAADGSEE